LKIAITADLHLTSRTQHPERFETLENLLADLRRVEVTTLIIAGDLFDASRQNYAEFEQICRRAENRDISIVIIPGNHDPSIDGRKIDSDNLVIMDSPTRHDFDGRPFLFLPYRAGKTMGEDIERFRDHLPKDEWVLVGHGDWAGGLSVYNPAEPGLYMPLTRTDIEAYRPARAFLGHIHLPSDTPPVHYAGSPCGLDINETGRRRCLFYDTDSDQVETHILDTPVLYFNETFIVVPVKDEAAYLREQISSRLESWGLQPKEKPKAQIRVKVGGYSADRGALRTVIDEAFGGFSFYKGQEPNLDDVSTSDDREREYIAQQVKASLEELAWPGDMDEPSADELLLEALQIIYKR